MGRCAIVILIVVVALSTTTARADLIGHYEVSGTGPDGLPYLGEVAVEMIGHTFHVIREIGGQRCLGTGIGRENVLAVTYRSGDTIVLALYAQDAGELRACK